MATRVQLPKITKTEVAVLRDLLTFHLEEAKECDDVATTVSGDLGWWRAKGAKHARFAAAIEIVLHNLGAPSSAA